MIEMVGLEIVKVGESSCNVLGYDKKFIRVNYWTDMLKNNWYPFKEYHHLRSTKSTNQGYNILVLDLAYDVHILDKSTRLDL